MFKENALTNEDKQVCWQLQHSCRNSNCRNNCRHSESLDSEIIPQLKALFDIFWSKEVPPDFRDAPIVNLFKNKGAAARCSNLRGIFANIIVRTLPATDSNTI